MQTGQVKKDDVWEVALELWALTHGYVALYRAGRFALAASVLERNILRNNDDVELDWLFLAMCQKRLGQDERARGALARAREWRAKAMRIPLTESAKFQALMREAELLFDGSLPELPGDLFAR